MLMRRRKSWLCALVGLVFVLFLLFMTFNLDPNQSDNQRIQRDNDIIMSQRVSELQYKLKLLESDLIYNKKTLLKVYEELQGLVAATGGNGNIVKKIDADINQIVEHSQLTTLNKLLGNMTSMSNACPSLSYQLAKTDSNLVDLYDKWPFDDIDGGVWKQGYEITTNDAEWQGRKLKVHLVPHSHNDPGWIKTFNQYFQQQTQYILNNIVDFLSKDPRRKFIWAEMSYLSLWMQVASEERKEKARALIRKGQLEIVGGGWVMNDEANTHYFAIIDQIIEGNDWLNRTFGVRPRSNWAIDPFGHTPTMGYLLNKMGFDNMLIQRVHYHVKKQLSYDKSLEFRWRQLWDADGKDEILCHMMPFYSYDVAHTCGPDPKICCQFDFARLPTVRVATCPWRIAPRPIDHSNIDERARTLLDQYRKKSKLFKTDTLLVILGDDFRYSKTSECQAQFDNYAMLFDYVNSQPHLNAHLQFSTLSEYFDDVRKDAGGVANFPSLSGDFFTYADREDHYWSGYYITRPFHKRQERVIESYLRAAEIAFSLALARARKSDNDKNNSFRQNLFPLLEEARRNMALFQHHDGITGTAKDFVVVDYGTRLLQSINNCQQLISASARVLVTDDADKLDTEASKKRFSMDEVFEQQNQYPRQRVIAVSDDKPAQVVIYNSLAHHRTGVVSLMVSSASVQVTGVKEDGEEVQVKAQLNLVWSDDDQLVPLTDKYQLVFVASVPALGFATYRLSATSSSPPITSYASVGLMNAMTNVKVGGGVRHPDTRFSISLLPATAELEVENRHARARFSSKTGMLERIEDKMTGQQHQVGLKFVRYTSRRSKDKSGAYLFLPSGPAVDHVHDSHEPPLIRLTKGDVMSQVHVIMDNVKHTVTLYGGDEDDGNKEGRVDQLGVHIRNLVDIRKGYDNQEIAMRMESDVRNAERRFFTDLNGFQLQPRRTYDKLPLQANFYPMPATALLQDKNKRLSLLSGQPLGVASLDQGQLDVILDRRLLQDDNRGLGQPIKDNVATPSTFVLLVERWKDGEVKSDDEKLAYPSLLHHRLSLELLHPTRVMEASGELLTRKVLPHVRKAPPCDMHVVNMRTIQHTPRSTALIVHTMACECRLLPPATAGGCRATDDAADVSSLRSVLPLADAVQPVTLSLQQDKNEFSLAPMQIEAFRVELVVD